MKKEEKVIFLARKSDSSISEIIRRCLSEKSPVFKQSIPAELQKDRARALLLLSKSSNNINQIAKALNTLRVENQLNEAQALRYLQTLDSIKLQLNLFWQKFETV